MSGTVARRTRANGVHADTPESALEKRRAALGLVEQCWVEVPTFRQGTEARACGQRLVDHACDLQGSDQDRPYLARTLCQISRVFRRHGWIDVARLAVERSIELEATDGHVFSELVECELAKGDVNAAMRVLQSAKDAGVPTDAVYTSVIKAFGRAGDVAAAERLFAQATHEESVTNFTYPAMIAAYGVAGDRNGAWAVFRQALTQRRVSPAACTAMMKALYSCADLDSIMQVWSTAKDHGGLSADVVRTAVRLLVRASRFRDARIVLASAAESGHADRISYQVFTSACHRAGRHHEAQRMVARARQELTRDEYRYLRRIQRVQRLDFINGARRTRRTSNTRESNAV